LRALFGAEAVTIRAELAKHVEKITLKPEGRTYVAAGTWDLLGVAAWMVPGARLNRFAHLSSPCPWPHDRAKMVKLGGMLLLPVPRQTD
jgi:hypothetical protein